MKLLILSILSPMLFLPTFAFAAQSPLADSSWVANGGELTYHVNFVLKNVEGVSKNVKGKGVCNSNSCKFLVASPIKDFISGDANRDMHMMEVTNGAVNPMVVVNIEFPISDNNENTEATVKIDFAGHSKTYKKVSIKSVRTADSIKAEGHFDFLLSEFNVERPALLTVKIDDKIVLDYKLDFKKVN